MGGGHAKVINSVCVCVYFRMYIFSPSKLYAQCRAQTHDPEIKSCMPYRLSQPGTLPDIYFLIFLFKNFLMFVYLFLRERERKQGRGRERIPSRLQAVSAEPEAGLEPTNREIVI